MVSETHVGLRFIDTEHGRQILHAATAALDSHFTIARQILGLLMADQGATEESPGMRNGHTATDAVTMLFDARSLESRTRTRMAYSAERGNVTPDRLAKLAPAQMKILKTLTQSQRPLDVVELTQHCQLQKKTVTNALSMLKAQRLIGTHDKRE